eukprot:CAMPEP_0202963082 /NCGR_PEP_ID=MMETSP1396-20130829/7078_1 /ASSEMBLY_ACC=CAM_ASM_000872 /TAXON_ID= /ORGANISM="Pseudokeronopsis sp., Strain Brazil" /LENGTH=33 /DNA_ID= /DNA_START= /DNA_END= /DNA_ORIENTATION=
MDEDIEMQDMSTRAKNELSDEAPSAETRHDEEN